MINTRVSGVSMALDGGADQRPGFYNYTCTKPIVASYNALSALGDSFWCIALLSHDRGAEPTC